MHVHTLHSWSWFLFEQKSGALPRNSAPLKIPSAVDFFRKRLSACPNTTVEEPVCHNQKTLAKEEEFTIDEQSENQLGPTRGGSGKFSVITMSLINETGWFGLHYYYVHASAGVTTSPREWDGNKEKILLVISCRILSMVLLLFLWYFI